MSAARPVSPVGAGRATTAVVVMGVSGSGKTTVARDLAERLGWVFAEGDGFHPAANVAKMASGHPLDDEDRAPWLAALRDWLAGRAEAGQDAVLTCSALKRTYRDVLRERGPGVVLLHLVGDPETLAQRMGGRADHFMPGSLLRSQLDTLEPLGADEAGTEVSILLDPAAIVDQAVRALHLA